MARERLQARIHYVFFAIVEILNASCRSNYAAGEWLEDALDNLEIALDNNEEINWLEIARMRDENFTGGLISIEDIYSSRKEHIQVGTCAKTIFLEPKYIELLTGRVLENISACYPLIEFAVRPGLAIHLVMRWYVLFSEQGREHFQKGLAVLQAKKQSNPSDDEGKE